MNSIGLFRKVIEQMELEQNKTFEFEEYQILYIKYLMDVNDIQENTNLYKLPEWVKKHSFSSGH